MPKEEKEIEIRSDEVQEILGYIPPKYIRYGIAVITSCVIVLLVGTWFFKYPDIVRSRIVLVSESPAVDVKSMVTGKVESIFVADGVTVSKHQDLALVENTADYNDICDIKEKLEDYKTFMKSYKLADIPNMDRLYALGSAQEYYSSFNKLIDDYKQFILLNYNSLKSEAVGREIAEYRLYIRSLKQQKNIQRKKLDLAITQNTRDSSLYLKQILSLVEWEASKSSLLQMQYSYESTKTSESNSKIQLSQYEQKLFDLKIDENRKLNKYRVDIKSAYEALQSRLKDWKQKYVVKSPIDGKLSFTKIWSKNQNIKSGDIFFSIIPLVESKIKGRISLPLMGSGKVKIGQKVNIQLDNYPYMEYGMLEGVVESISFTTNEDMYIVEVVLPTELVTNYGEKLVFKHQMQGNAEIVTKDIRLLERLFSPLRYLFEKMD
jgi:HlyD family secretion protein